MKLYIVGFFCYIFAVSAVKQAEIEQDSNIALMAEEIHHESNETFVSAPDNSALPEENLKETPIQAETLTPLIASPELTSNRSSDLFNQMASNLRRRGAGDQLINMVIAFMIFSLTATAGIMLLTKKYLRQDSPKDPIQFSLYY